MGHFEEFFTSTMRHFGKRPIREKVQFKMDHFWDTSLPEMAHFDNG